MNKIFCKFCDYQLWLCDIPSKDEIEIFFKHLMVDHKGSLLSEESFTNKLRDYITTEYDHNK